MIAKLISLIFLSTLSTSIIDAHQPMTWRFEGTITAESTPHSKNNKQIPNKLILNRKSKQNGHHVPVGERPYNECDGIIITTQRRDNHRNRPARQPRKVANHPQMLPPHYRAEIRN